MCQSSSPTQALIYPDVVGCPTAWKQQGRYALYNRRCPGDKQFPFVEIAGVLRALTNGGEVFKKGTLMVMEIGQTSNRLADFWEHVKNGEWSSGEMIL